VLRTPDRAAEHLCDTKWIALRGSINEGHAAMAQTVILGEKVGMTQTWVEDKIVPVTVLRIEPMRVVQIKTAERDGYVALQVTYGHRGRRDRYQPRQGLRRRHEASQLQGPAGEPR
jgi:hypothetical protein